MELSKSKSIPTEPLEQYPAVTPFTEVPLKSGITTLTESDDPLVALKTNGTAAFLGTTEPVYVRANVVRLLNEAAHQLPTGFGLVLTSGWKHPMDDIEHPGHWSLEGDVSTGGVVSVGLSHNGIDLSLGGVMGDPRTQEPEHYEPVRQQFQDAGITSPIVRQYVEQAWVLRRLLNCVMTNAGFASTQQWWRYEHGTKLWAKQKRVTRAQLYKTVGFHQIATPPQVSDLPAPERFQRLPKLPELPESVFDQMPEPSTV